MSLQPIESNIRLFNLRLLEIPFILTCRVFILLNINFVIETSWLNDWLAMNTFFVKVNVEVSTGNDSFRSLDFVRN